MERSAEISSADALSVGKKNQELEEAMETLRLETVMAVSGAKNYRSVGVDERMVAEEDRPMGSGQGFGAIQDSCLGGGQE